MDGKMIWFNAEKGFGYIRTEDDERLFVAQDGFQPGEVPNGRCTGRDVTFERIEADNDTGAAAVGVYFSSKTDPRRARARHQRSGRSL
jgi:cold shock CspA family protein